MYRVISVIALFLVGCGGSKAPAEAGKPGTVAMTPGLKCLDLAKVPRAVSPNAPARMDVAHIVVRYAGLRDSERITLTREEACLRAAEVRDKLLAGGDWDKLYEEYSDTKDAMKGVFRSVSQDNLETAFGDTAFSLKVDELSQVVETDKGFHVIWRMK
jgi:hypothetical protein